VNAVEEAFQIQIEPAGSKRGLFFEENAVFRA
jgi:hypothetical protein